MQTSPMSDLTDQPKMTPQLVVMEYALTATDRPVHSYSAYTWPPCATGLTWTLHGTVGAYDTAVLSQPNDH